MPVTIPTAVAAFPHEALHDMESAVRAYLGNIVQYTLMPAGGHFAAMEQPKLLAEDIRSFIRLVENAAAADK